MTNSAVSDLMYEFFLMAIQLAGPPLLLSMLIGILIAIIQAATQIHEQTLTFVPSGNWACVGVYRQQYVGFSAGFYSQAVSNNTGRIVLWILFCFP